LPLSQLLINRTDAMPGLGVCVVCGISNLC